MVWGAGWTLQNPIVWEGVRSNVLDGTMRSNAVEVHETTHVDLE